MNKNTGLIIIAALSVMTLAILGIGLTQDPKEIKSMLIAKQAPDFMVADLTTEQQFELKKFKGKPIILNFWASWCEACKQEARELERYHQNNGSNVHVIGIAIQDEFAAARKFANYYKKTYKLGLDQTGEANTEYGIVGVPETFFIDTKGVVQKKHIGPLRYVELENYISMLN